MPPSATTWMDLRAAGGDRLEINGAGLLKLQPDPRVPFVVSMSAGRPPFRCMDPFRIDNTVYEQWKREHPNFLGFWTGVEWDNEYITPLTSPAGAADWARKHGCSEAAIERMQEILARARASRQGAVAGLRECHAALRKYFFDDPDKMLFLRAGWCFDHYALEWGAGMVISETTNTDRIGTRSRCSMSAARPGGIASRGNGTSPNTTTATIRAAPAPSTTSPTI